MRTCLALLLLAATAFGHTQDDPAKQNLFLSVRPDISVVVKAHPTGANLVEITLLNPNYPPALLEERMKLIAVDLGAQANGLTAGTFPLSSDPDMKFVKGSFGINGLMDTKLGIVRVQPILKALVGDPEPLTLKGVSIVFEGIQANKKMIQTFRTKALNAQARILKSPVPGIEYRIAVFATDPKDIEFPDQVPEPKPQLIPSQTDEPIPWVAWVGLGTAALGAAALVYLALLRTGKGGTKRPDKRG